MAKFKLINNRGASLSFPDNEYCTLINISGQTNAVSSISSTTVGGIDGDTVNAVRANPRSITLDLRMNSRYGVEVSQRNILKVIKLKQKITLEWTQDGMTKVIEGIVESVDMPRWNKSVIMQVTLHCEQPFWEDAQAIVQRIDEAIDLHYFTGYYNDMLYFPEEGIPLGEFNTIRTKSFFNDGAVAVGLTITITAVDRVTNPIIQDADGNFFGVGYGTGARQVLMESGDVIRITTGKGNKTVTLNRVNILDRIKPNSTWLQLQTGENQFAINSDDDSLTNMYFNVEYKQRYI